MGRLLSLDFGRKRTGIAVTDVLQLIPGGLDTVLTKDLLKYLKDYCLKEPVDKIIIGLPKQMNYEDSESMKYIKPFLGKLKKTFPKMPIEMYDERFTSVLAHKTMLESGIGKKARQNKELVDKISAVIILQSYLEQKIY